MLKRIKPRSAGASITEMFFGLFFFAFIVAVLAKLFFGSFSFLQRTQARGKMALESRACMDMIAQNLKAGKARTLVISTPAASPLVPNSRVDFNLQNPLPSGATSYAIYLANGVVYAQEGTRAPRALASNVAALIFSGSARDPAMVGVTLQISSPIDKNSPDATRVSSVAPATQIIHMSELP